MNSSTELEWSVNWAYLQEMKRYGKPQKLGDVLGEWVRSMGVEGPLARGTVVARWEGILGESLGQHVEKSWVKGSKLFVRVPTAAWRQEFHHRREEWRVRLNEEMGSEVITEIVFR